MHLDEARAAPGARRLSEMTRLVSEKAWRADLWAPLCPQRSSLGAAELLFDLPARMGPAQFETTRHLAELFSLACLTTCPMEVASGAYQDIAHPDKATKTAVRAKGARVDRTALVSQWRRSSDFRRLNSA